MYQPSTKTPKKVFQKGGFCNAKRGFLHAKSMVFALQKPPFGKKQIGVLEKLKPLAHYRKPISF